MSVDRAEKPTNAHRGRVQAQANKPPFDESEKWEQPTALTRPEGLAVIDELEGKLERRERARWAAGFERCRKFMREAPRLDAPCSKNFPGGLRREKGGIRVDFELWAGQAFSS